MKKSILLPVMAMAFISNIYASFNWKSCVAVCSAAVGLYGLYKMRQKYESVDLSKLTDVVGQDRVLIQVNDQPILQIPVLQQEASEPFMLHNKNIENDATANILGISGHTWNQVRTEESLNCGFHALKNIQALLKLVRNSENTADRIHELLQSSQSNISGLLLDREYYIHETAIMAPQIFELRKTNIDRHLGTEGIKDLKNAQEVCQARAILKAKASPSFGDIHPNQHYIKTNFLSGSEMEHLINNSDDAADIFVLEFVPDMQGLAEFPFAKFTELMQQRLEQFKKNENDQIGVVWTESGYPHWIAYVVIKRLKKITMYEMNSDNRPDLQPSHRKVVVNLFHN